MHFGRGILWWLQCQSNQQERNIQLDCLPEKRSLIWMEVLSPIETVSACENNDKQSHCHWQVYEQQPCPSLTPPPKKTHLQIHFLIFLSYFYIKSIIAIFWQGMKQFINTYYVPDFRKMVTWSMIILSISESPSEVDMRPLGQASSLTAAASNHRHRSATPWAWTVLILHAWQFQPRDDHMRYVVSLSWGNEVFAC